MKPWQAAASALLALMVVGFALGQPLPPKEQKLYEGIAPDERLLELDKQVLDEAYHIQLQKLFGVWLSQGAPQDAQNLRRGLQIARRAYAQAHEQIERREQELKK